MKDTTRTRGRHYMDVQREYRRSLIFRPETSVAYWNCAIWQNNPENYDEFNFNDYGDSPDFNPWGYVPDFNKSADFRA